MKYTLYTEYKPNLYRLVNKYFDGATFTRCFGMWKGKKEQSIQIVIFTGHTLNITLLAEKIKSTNKQESILIEKAEVEWELK